MRGIRDFPFLAEGCGAAGLGVPPRWGLGAGGGRGGKRGGRRGPAVAGAAARSGGRPGERRHRRRRGPANSSLSLREKPEFTRAGTKSERVLSNPIQNKAFPPFSPPCVT